MTKPNIVALFCEDIREEKNEILTLVGILPSHLSVTPAPGQNWSGDGRPSIPKLCVYVRFNFYDELAQYKVRVVMADGHVLDLGQIQAHLIEQAKRESKEKNTALAGVVLRAAFANVPLIKPGLVRLEVEAAGQIEVVGGVVFDFPDSTNPSSTAQPPPS